jgi:hypothetical protein
VYAFVHTILAALLTAGMLVVALSAWHLRRGTGGAGVFEGSMRLALPIVAVAGFLQFFVGHFDGVLMPKQQAMNMAAADAVFNTKHGAGLSLFATGDFESNLWGAFIGPGPRERVGGGLRRTVRRLARSSFLVPGGCGSSRRWFPRAWARARVGAAAFALAGVQGARDRGAAS